MSNKRYPEEFKIQAVKQITDRGHPVAEVSWSAGRLTAQPVPVAQAIWRRTGRAG